MVSRVQSGLMVCDLVQVMLYIGLGPLLLAYFTLYSGTSGSSLLLLLSLSISFSGTFFFDALLELFPLPVLDFLVGGTS